jgi:hypothetical protein
MLRSSGSLGPKAFVSPEIDSSSDSNGGTRCASSSTSMVSAPSKPAWYGRILRDTPYPSNNNRDPIMSTVPTTIAVALGSDSHSRLSAN